MHCGYDTSERDPLSYEATKAVTCSGLSSQQNIVRGTDLHKFVLACMSCCLVLYGYVLIVSTDFLSSTQPYSPTKSNLILKKTKSDNIYLLNLCNNKKS